MTEIYQNQKDSWNLYLQEIEKHLGVQVYELTVYVWNAITEKFPLITYPKSQIFEDAVQFVWKSEPNYSFRQKYFYITIFNSQLMDWFYNHEDIIESNEGQVSEVLPEIFQQLGKIYENQNSKS